MTSRRLVHHGGGNDEDVVGVGEMQPLFPNNIKRTLSFGEAASSAAESLSSDDDDDDEDEERNKDTSPKHDKEDDDISLFHLNNLAIPIAYLVFGMMQGLVRTFLNVYPLDLGASEAQQTTLATITTLPCAMKILYGFASDNVPLFGYRRKPYILLGWFLAFSMATILLTSCDLSLTATLAHHEHDANDKQSPPPSMEFLSLVFFVLGIGIWFADATCDAVVAEKTQHESEKHRGAIQSSCYVARYAGVLMASTVSTYLYDSGNGGPRTVVLCIAAIPWILFPFLYYFKEDKNVDIHSVKHQSLEIWKTICSQSVWEPMAFIYIFNLLQVPNPAWRQFLSTIYHFSSTELNLLVVTTYALLLAGMILYKCCFLQTSWRKIFILCILFNAICSSLQLFMIQGKIPRSWNPFWFALGDDALMELMIGIQKLPITILMMSLCPVGSEGVSYAMLTTLDNSAHMLSQALSTALLGLWDTSKQTFEAGDVDGIFNLSILTTIIQLSPIVCIGWMPRNRNELFALRDKPWSGSPVGGTVILVVLLASMIWTVTISLLNIMDPGWNGEF